MSEPNNNETKKETGIEVENITFDDKGQVAGLDESVLDEAAGGLASVDAGVNAEACINLYKC
jgi:hypothetical protein